MTTILQTDLFGHIPTKLPRLPSVKGCAADRATNSERQEFLSRLNINAERQEIRRPILEAREVIKRKQSEIGAIRKQRAAIKRQSRGNRKRQSLIAPAWMSSLTSWLLNVTR
jgi:hypothetical protein